MPSCILADMTRYLLTLLLAAPTLSWAQHNAPHQLVGRDNEPRMNKQEGQLLDSLLRTQRHEFSFVQKQVAFAYGGSNGRELRTKSFFFTKCVLPWVENGHQPALLFLPLTASEQQTSGGYEALVVAWAKTFSAKRKTIVLQRLRK
jgi:hypothetical protein